MLEISAYFDGCMIRRTAWEKETVYLMCKYFIGYLYSSEKQLSPMVVKTSEDRHLELANILFGI